MLLTARNSLLVSQNLRKNFRASRFSLCQIDIVNHARILGLITNDLKRNQHITNIIKKTNKRIFFIIQLKRAHVPDGDIIPEPTARSAIPGVRVTKSAPSEFQSRCRWAMGMRFFMVFHDVMPTDLKNMADYRVEWF